MDPLTHGLSGALLALVFGIDEKYRWMAMAVLIAAAVAPDLDALPILFGQRCFYQYHRVVFHSLAGAFLLAFVISIVVFLLTPLKDYPLILIFSVTGVLLHLGMDLLSSWELPLFSPLSPSRVSLDLVWFIDLFILFVIIGALSWSHADPAWASTIVRLAVLLIAAYVGFRWYQQRTITELVRREKLSEASSTVLAVIPSKADITLWHAVVQKNDEYVVHDVHFCLAPRGTRVLGVEAEGTHILSTQIVRPSLKKDVIAASKEAELVRLFLDRVRFPIASVKKRETGYRVEWEDVHLTLAGGGIRGVIVQMDEQDRVTEQQFKLKPELESLRQD